MSARSPATDGIGRELARALRRAVLAAALALAAMPGAARAQDASPHAIDIPTWFTESFLDFREDIRDAAREGRRLMLYFGQDGCPYCRALMTTNFSQRGIVEKTRRHFVAIALNLWGDRETTWIDGRTMSEKALARRLDVQFTPTLLFLDERGRDRGAAQRLLPAAPVRSRARLCGRQARAEAPRSPPGSPGMSGIRRARAWPTSPSSCRRRTTFDAARAESRSPCCSRPPIAVRATNCIGRDSSGRRCARCSNGSTSPGSRSARPHALTTPTGQVTTAAGVGDGARSHIHADHRVFRRGQVARCSGSTPTCGRSISNRRSITWPAARIATSRRFSASSRDARNGCARAG